MERYKETLSQLKTIAKELKHRWKDYYMLKDMFALVEYAYAMTVHKSQGSTMDTIFIDHKDLVLCKNEEMYNLIYVATTRPANKLVLLL